MPLDVGNNWLYNFWGNINNEGYDLIDEDRYLKIVDKLTIDGKSYYRVNDNLLVGPFIFMSGNNMTILENRIGGLYVGQLPMNETMVDWVYFFKYPVLDNELYYYKNLSIEVTREKVVTYYNAEFDCILYSFGGWKVYIAPGKGFVRFIESEVLLHDLMFHYLHWGVKVYEK